MFKYTVALPEHVLEKNASDYYLQTKEERHFEIDHAKKSKQYFTQHTKMLSGKALILGPGHMRDLPQKHIADTFSEVTFIDIDDYGANKWKRRFPNVKTTIWLEDFTQIQGRIIQEISSIQASSTSELLFQISQIYEHFVQEKFTDYLPAETYDFISASVILSQVNTNLQNHYFSLIGQEELQRTFYEGNVLEKMALQNLEKSYASLALKIQKDLLHWMHNRLTPDGVLLLTMTPMVYEDYITPHTQKIESSAKSALIDLPKINQEIEKLFLPLSVPKKWKWDLQPASQSNNWTHRHFIVLAQTHKKK